MASFQWSQKHYRSATQLRISCGAAQRSPVQTGAVPGLPKGARASGSCLYGTKVLICNSSASNYAVQHLSPQQKSPGFTDPFFPKHRTREFSWLEKGLSLALIWDHKPCNSSWFPPSSAAPCLSNSCHGLRRYQTAPRTSALRPCRGKDSIM